MKKLGIFLLSLLMISTMLMGCKPKVGPDESAKNVFNFLLKGDQAGVAKMGMSQKEIDDAAKEEKKSFDEGLKAVFSSAGLTVKDDKIEEITKAMMESLKKVTIDAQVVSESKDSAEVKIKTTYVDFVAVSKKVVDISLAEIKTQKETDQKKLESKFTDLLVKNFIAEFKNAKASTDTKEQTFKFIIKDRIWQPENMQQCSEAMGRLATGQ